MLSSLAVLGMSGDMRVAMLFPAVVDKRGLQEALGQTRGAILPVSVSCSTGGVWLMRFARVSVHQHHDVIANLRQLVNLQGM